MAVGGTRCFDLERVCVRIDYASSTEDDAPATAGGDVHALADTGLDTANDPDSVADRDADANRAPHLNPDSAPHLDPTPDFNAAATDANGHRR